MVVYQKPVRPPDDIWEELGVQEAFGSGKDGLNPDFGDASPDSEQRTKKCDEGHTDDELFFRVPQQQLGDTQARPELKITPPSGEKYDEVSPQSFSNDDDLTIHNNPNPFPSENDRQHDNPPPYDGRSGAPYQTTNLSKIDDIDQGQFSEEKTDHTSSNIRTTGGGLTRSPRRVNNTASNIWTTRGLTRSPRRFNNLTQYDTPTPRSNLHLHQNQPQFTFDEEKPPAQDRSTESIDREDRLQSGHQYPHQRFDDQLQIRPPYLRGRFDSFDSLGEQYLAQDNVENKETGKKTQTLKNIFRRNSSQALNEELGYEQDNVTREYEGNMEEQPTEGQNESLPNENKNRLKGLFRKSK